MMMKCLSMSRLYVV